MSTKIYEAWRVSTVRLNGVLDRVGEHMRSRVTAHVDRLISRGEDVREIFKKAEAAAQAPERDLEYDLECGVRMWNLGRHFYIIPFGEPWTRRDLSLPAYAADFSYWNNSDRPEGVSAATWRKRQQTWDRVMGKHSRHLAKRCLVHYAVNMNNPILVFEVRKNLTQPTRKAS